MANQNRANLIKEGIYYTLGILLICGFVYLYWGHFMDAPGPPSASRYIMGHWGMRATITINAAVFLLFILFSQKKKIHFFFFFHQFFFYYTRRS